MEFDVDRATARQIADHLWSCDRDFVPRLSERVEIGEYATKIARCATRFEVWTGSTLVGLVAVYCNGIEGRSAYITTVSVRAAYQRKGLASRLLADCIEHVRGLDLDHVALEVDMENSAAIELYARNGFQSASVSGRTVRMGLEIRGSAADMGGDH